MGGIILIIVVVFLSVLIRKVATVALKLTGLDKSTASFQALSALNWYRLYHQRSRIGA